MALGGVGTIAAGHVVGEAIIRVLPDSSSFNIGDILKKQLSGVDTQIAKYGTLLAGAGAAAGPLVGLVAGLGTGFAAAGAGAAAFGALAKTQLQPVFAATSQVTKAQDAYNKALASGDPKKAAAAQKQLNAAMAGLDPVQKTAVLGLVKLKASWKDLSESVKPQVYGIFNNALATANNLLPKLKPLAGAAGTAFQQLSAQMKNAFTGPGFAQGLKQLTAATGPAIKSIGQSIGNLGVTLGHTFQAALPIMNTSLGVLQHITSSLRNASAGPGLKNFFISLQPAIQALGPMIDSVGRALGALLKGAVPLAKPLITTIQSIADALTRLFNSANFHTFTSNLGQILTALQPVFRTLADAIGKILALLSGQLLAVMPQVVQVISTLANVFANVVAGISPLLPVLLQVVQAFVNLIPVIYPVITALRDALMPVFKAIADALVQLQPAIKLMVDGLGQMLRAIGPVVATIIKALVPVLQAIMQAVAPLLPVIGQLAAVFGNALAQALQAIAPLISSLGPLIAKLAQGLVPLFAQALQIIQPLIPIFVDLAKSIGGAFLQALIACEPLIKAVLDIVQALEPVLKLAAWAIDFFIKALVVAPLKAFATAIGWVADAVGWVAGLFDSGDGKMKRMITDMENQAKAADPLAQSWKDVGIAAANFHDRLPDYQNKLKAYKDAQKGYDDAVKQSLDQVRANIDVFSKVDASATVTAADINKSVADMTTAAATENANIKKLLDAKIPTDLINQLVAKGPQFVQAVAATSDPVRKQLVGNFGKYLDATNQLNNTQIRAGLNADVNTAASTLAARRKDMQAAFTATFATPIQTVLNAVQGAAQAGGTKVGIDFALKLVAQKDSVLNKALATIPGPVGDAIRLAITNATTGGGGTGHGFGVGLDNSTPFAISKAQALKLGINGTIDQIKGVLAPFGITVVTNDDATPRLQAIINTMNALAGQAQAAGINLGFGPNFGRAAVGGAITGPGGPTEDKVPILASAGEHMWTTREVQAVGGHGPMYALRNAALAGAFRFAAGGPVQTGDILTLNVDRDLAGMQFAATRNNQALSSKIQEKLAAEALRSAVNTGGGSAGAKALAAAMLAAHGQASQFPALLTLWTMESGWNPSIVNSSSGAYGIPQALPAVWGHPYALGDVGAQVPWGLNYIWGRYGGPNNALAHEYAYNWYAKGGPIQQMAGGGEVLNSNYRGVINSLPVSELMGLMAFSSVRQAQQAMNIPVDGIVGPQTTGALRSLVASQAGNPRAIPSNLALRWLADKIFVPSGGSRTAAHAGASLPSHPAASNTNAFRNFITKVYHEMADLGYPNVSTAQRALGVPVSGKWNAQTLQALQRRYEAWQVQQVSNYLHALQIANFVDKLIPATHYGTGPGPVASGQTVTMTDAKGQQTTVPLMFNAANTANIANLRGAAATAANRAAFTGYITANWQAQNRQAQAGLGNANMGRFYSHISSVVEYGKILTSMRAHAAPAVIAAEEKLWTTYHNQELAYAALQAREQQQIAYTRQMITSGTALTGVYQRQSAMLTNQLAGAVAAAYAPAITSISQGIQKNAQTGGDLTSIFSYQAGYGATSASAAISVLRAKIARTKAFVGNLRNLALAGVDPTLLAELANAGEQVAGPIAQAILADPHSVMTLNALEGQLAAIGAGGGAIVGNAAVASRTGGVVNSAGGRAIDPNNLLGQGTGRGVSAGSFVVMGDLIVHDSSDVAAINHALFVQNQNVVRAVGG